MKTKDQIKARNDTLRTTFFSQVGKVVLSESVANLKESNDEKFQELITAVREFNGFTKDNDPHGEHDFGQVEIDGEKFFFKIDYYDMNLEYGADPYEDDYRPVMTIMYASEY